MEAPKYSSTKQEQSLTTDKLVTFDPKSGTYSNRGEMTPQETNVWPKGHRTCF